ncbi:MAG: Ig-like domain-containing protein [Dysgonamonadaceae bacterium]|jgi:uncharacterized protein YjdB|nr:Ig-like domain-containing protein [Dysgonamonadaceae bacterium]
MKKIILLFASIALLFSACGKDEEQGLTDVKEINISGVSNDTVKLTVADTYQLNIATTPANAVNSLKFVSSNARIFTVSDKGLITAKGGGTGTLIVVGPNGEEYKKARVTIDVTQYVESVTRNDTYKC